MKHPKPIKAFCAVTPDGELLLYSVDDYAQKSRLLVAVAFSRQWKTLQKTGYRIVKVEIKVKGTK